MLIKLQKMIDHHKGIYQNPDLKLLNFDKINLLYELQLTDNNAKKIIKKMKVFEKGIRNLESFDQISSLYDTYSEGLVYLHLKDKFQTTYKEQKGANLSSAPDFECSLGDNGLSSKLSFFTIEVKTPNIKEFKGGLHTTKRKPQIMDIEKKNNTELDAAYKKVKQEMKGQCVCVIRTHTIKDPLSPNTQDELKYIWKIKRTIKICNEMIKSTQFVSGSLNFILFNFARIESTVGIISDDDIVPNYINPSVRRYPKIDSGFLWHVAFGRNGSPIWGGAISDPLEGYLDINGFLVDHPEYAGLLFLTQNGQFYGFYNSIYEHSNYAKLILSKITNGKINNDRNSYGYEYITKMVLRINEREKET